MASLPCFLYGLVDGNVVAKECKDMATYKRFLKAGFKDSPAGMSEDFPEPGSERDNAVLLRGGDEVEVLGTGEKRRLKLSDAVDDALGDDIDDNDIDLDDELDDEDDVDEEDEDDAPPPRPRARKAAKPAKKKAAKKAPKKAAPAAPKLDILKLTAKEAAEKLASVDNVELLKKLREREKGNQKTPGGRKPVLAAIAARIADLV